MPFAEEESVAWAGHVLERARWAARAFGTFDRSDVLRIVEAVTQAAEANAQRYAEWAVEETKFGVVEDKVTKNLACSRGLVNLYAGDDFVSPRVDRASQMVEIPRPAGVVLALTPSTNPVATLYFKVLLALMTRNAIVISPHPYAKQVCVDAARTLADAAVAAGAPDGTIQCIEAPSIPLVDALMHDPRTNVILATGGTPMVRAAYSSSNPAIGVGPGNAPVLVDDTADLKSAAREIVASKAFDNSVLCTNESVLVVLDSVADKLQRDMEREGALFLDAEQTQALRNYMFPLGHLNTDVIGRPAHVIAEAAGIKATARTKVLVAPFDVVVPEEPLTHEKLSPVLGMIRVPDVKTGIAAARAVVRITGAGHSAAIHSSDPETITEYSVQVPVLRVSVNVGNSAGSAGLTTSLALSMTIGTGFVGRSSLGENLQPKHLFDWTRIAWSKDSGDSMPAMESTMPWSAHHEPVPAYPVASNAVERKSDAGRKALAGLVADRVSARVGGSVTIDERILQAEVRRLVAQELSNLMKG